MWYHVPVVGVHVYDTGSTVVAPVFMWKLSCPVSFHQNNHLRKDPFPSSCPTKTTCPELGTLSKFAQVSMVKSPSSVQSGASGTVTVSPTPSSENACPTSPAAYVASPWSVPSRPCATSPVEPSPGQRASSPAAVPVHAAALEGVEGVASTKTLASVTIASAMCSGNRRAPSAKTSSSPVEGAHHGPHPFEKQHVVRNANGLRFPSSRGRVGGGGGRDETYSHSCHLGGRVGVDGRRRGAGARRSSRHAASRSSDRNPDHRRARRARHLTVGDPDRADRSRR